jgi:hypothetical protein
VVTPSTTGRPARDPRIIALRNFTISISVLSILGYTVLGFEQGWAWPLIAVATGYTMELGLEAIAAWAERRPPRFRGHGLRGLVEFLYPAHITSLAVTLLVYVNDQILVMMLAVMIGVGGKWLLRVPVNGRMRHFMNPSNLGIMVVLLLFPWANLVQPYHFTEWVSGFWDWFVPAVIVVAGTMLNATLTKRMWLIAAWLIGFVLQAVIRGVLGGVAIPAALLMMTGVAFVLFTNYMITDPGTTPAGRWGQIAFGGGAAALYGLITGVGIVYGLIFCLAGVCLIRGCFLWALHLMQRADARAEAERRAAPISPATEPVPTAEPVPAAGPAPLEVART